MKDLDKLELLRFIDNKPLKAAVKDFLLDAIELSLKSLSVSTSNAELGDLVKAKLEAIKLVEAGFIKMERLKETKTEESLSNPAV